MDSSIGKYSRLRTIFHDSDRAFVVAFDHGILMGPVDGIQDIVTSVKKVVSGNPDAIQLTPPLAKVLSENFLGRNSPSLIARLDTSNLWRSTPAPKNGYYTDFL